jgi:hypothetical protein
MSTTRGPVRNIARQLYDDRIVRLNSDMVWARDTAVETLTGSVVFGAALYDSTIWIDRVSGTGTITAKRLTRIGGGWDRFRTLTRSNVTAGDRGFDRSYARSATTAYDTLAGHHLRRRALHGPDPTQLADEADRQAGAGQDKDTKSGYLYAVGHANGTATVIKSLGKVPATFGDPVDFRWSSYYDAPLFGE